MKNTTSRNIRQVFSSSSIIPTFCPVDNLITRVGSLSRRLRLIVNEIVYFNKRGLNAYFSQETLGAKVGIGRQRTNVLLKDLLALGLISKKTRYVSTSDGRRNKTSVYQVHPGMFGYLRQALTRYIPNLLGITLASLVSFGYVHADKLFKQNATQLKKEYKYISYRFGSYIHDYVRGGIRHHSRQPARYKKRSRKLVMHVVRQFYGENPFGAAIDKVAEVMPLTNWGKIKLSAFQDRVILNALKALLDSQVPIERPVLWLFKKCIEVSRSHKYPINWDWMKQLAIAYQMPADQDLVLVRGNWTFKPEKSNKPSHLRNQKREAPTPTVKAKIDGGQPLELRYIDRVAEYARFEQLRREGKFEEVERALGMRMSNPHKNAVMALTLSDQELMNLGLGELCQSSTSSPENLVPLSKEGELRQRSDHFSKSEKLSGMSPLKVSMETGHQSTSQSTWKPVSSSMTQLISTFQKNLFDDL